VTRHELQLGEEPAHLVDVRDVLRRVLERSGYQVCACAGGDEALQCLAEGEYDAMVSDVRMPGMSGLNLLRAVRERDLDLPIILVTGNPELASATDLSAKVNEALAQSAALIVICSPRSATSRWVNEEVLAFKRLNRSHPIFCLIVDGEPNASDLAGREAEECFAPALRFQLDADGQPTHERTEPIAADARAGKDGKATAKLKLISGLLDVGFDALKQREQQRRVRRMAAITALALLVMLVTTALALRFTIRAESITPKKPNRKRMTPPLTILPAWMNPTP